MRALFLLTMAAALTLSATSFADEAMPTGVKLKQIRIMSGAATVLGDAKGMTLYTFDNDKTPGKSSCNAKCAENWPPLAAPADAKPMGNWTVVSRDDGSKQWAFKGKPLYTFVQDISPAYYKGNGLPADKPLWHYVVPEGPMPDVAK
jgi:predicted lipoprotein with Yx(FWY)xxD motif